jgi:hypothetical protein
MTNRSFPDLSISPRHKRLTVRHDSADRRLTDVHGKVVREVLS